MWEGLSPPYGTIVADPPWRGYGANGASVGTKGDPAKRYSVMGVDEIAELPVMDLAAASSHLWSWVCNWSMREGFDVVDRWGFRPVNIVTWCKPGPGVGYYLRSNTEHAIFATRGDPVTPEDKPLSTWFKWPRARHSEKPAGFGDLVEQVSPGPYVELFCRRPRFGWDSWGHGYEIGAAS